VGDGTAMQVYPHCLPLGDAATKQEKAPLVGGSEPRVMRQPLPLRRQSTQALRTRRRSRAFQTRSQAPELLPPPRFPRPSPRWSRTGLKGSARISGIGR